LWLIVSKLISLSPDAFDNAQKETTRANATNIHTQVIG
jgi:hypothetical protein